MAVIFGHLPENIEPKQCPLPRSRDSPAVVFKERQCVVTVDDASCAGFDHRTIKSLIIHYIWRFWAAFDQLRPVSGLHLGGNMLGQPVDTPARGEMDAPVDAVLKRVPISAELKIDQLQPAVSDQTIIRTRIMMKICMEGSWFGQVFGYDSQFFINSQSRLDSGNLRHVAKRRD